MPTRKDAKQAWNQAESEYVDFYASLSLAMFAEPMSPEDNALTSCRGLFLQ
jgi:hypothetical protein